MTERLTTHDKFMVLVQSCIDGELILTADEIMGYADECTWLSRCQEIERLKAYMDYLDMKLSKLEKKGLMIA